MSNRSCKKSVKTVVVGTILAWVGVMLVLASFLSGCGGQGPGDVDVGDAVGGEDADPTEVPREGAYCEVPSPTGDAVNAATGRTAREELAWERETGSFIAYAVASNAGDVPDLCRSFFPGAACDDPAHDFEGRDGRKVCLVLTRSRLSGEPCRPGTLGEVACAVTSLGYLDEGAGKPRATAVCSPSGSFVGWWCNNI